VGGAGKRVASAMVYRLEERAWSEIKNDHGLDLLKQELGHGASLGVRIHEELLGADDGCIKDDKHRSATNDQIEKDTGAKPVWLKTGGIGKIGGELKASVPVAGMLTASAGFCAEGVLEYTSLRPVPLTTDGAANVALQHTVKLPFNADNALAMERGSEVEVIGKGTASLKGSVGTEVGRKNRFIGASAGARVGAEGGLSSTWAVRVKRLDGDNVEVRLSNVNDRFRTFGAAADAGLRLQGKNLVDATVGGLLDPARHKISLDAFSAWFLKAKPGEDLVDFLTRKGVEPFEKAVKDYTAFYASVGHDAKEVRTDRRTYVFDLKNPAAKAAYEQLVRLQHGEADKLSKQLDSGVTRKTTNDVVTESKDTAKIEFAGKKLVIQQALERDRVYQNRVDLDHGAAAPEISRIASYEQTAGSIVTGNHNIVWEAVSVPSPNPEDPQSTYFHLAVKKNDLITLDEDIEWFVRFADMMGIVDDKPRKIDMPRSAWWWRMISPADDTKIDVDIYFTDDGIERLTKADAKTARQAYADAVGFMTPKLAGLPVNDARCQELVDDHEAAKLRSLQPPYDMPFRVHDYQIRHDARHEYAQRTGGRELIDDVYDMKQARAFGEAIGEMRDTRDEKAWVKCFTNLGKSRGFDYAPIMGALHKIVGAEDTLVHKLAIKGSYIGLESKDEGALQAPDLDSDEVARCSDSDRRSISSKKSDDSDDDDDHEPFMAAA
jgi:hypothetical protein